jgi:hypothetical protein
MGFRGGRLIAARRKPIATEAPVQAAKLLFWPYFIGLNSMPTARLIKIWAVDWVDSTRP